MSIFDTHPDISSLHLCYFTSYAYILIPSDEDRQNGLAKSIRYVWVDNRHEETPVARVTIEHWDQFDWISCYDLFISEDYRGYGLSHELVEFVKYHGVTHLSVHKNNSVAIKLYEKHGFVANGEKDGDLIRMELSTDEDNKNFA